MEYIIYRKKLNFDNPEANPVLPGNIQATNNPDFESLYSNVDFWLLEVDEERCLVNREVGIDKENHPIVLGPWGYNYGVWVDNTMDIDKVKHEKSTESEFEAMWERAKIILNNP